MMNLSEFRSQHPRWSRFLGLPPLSASVMIRNRAYNLMSLASISMFVGVIILLFMLAYAVAGQHIEPPQSSYFSRLLLSLRLSKLRPGPIFRIIVVFTLAFIAFLAPLIALRRLAKALYQGLLLNMVVASRFDRLANALLLSFLISYLLKLWSVIPMGYTPIATSFFGFFGFLIAVSLCHTMAGIIREGARAAEENQEFV